MRASDDRLSQRRNKQPVGDHQRYTDRLIYGLRALWLVVLVGGEYLAFRLDAAACSWPDDELGGAVGTEDDVSPPFHLLIVADPQILDLRSYPGRPWLGKWASRLATDNYARKAWQAVLNRQRPHGIFFLGDLLDSGVEVTDRGEHSHYVHRFHDLFPTRNLPAVYMPGNHDLGLHASAGGSAYARERFRDSFGELEGATQFGNHTLIWIDAMALLDESPTGTGEPMPGTARYFVKQHSATIESLPTILFSHIPLWRPDGTPCGTSREHAQPIYQGRGRNYQNELDEGTSRFLLDTLQPVYVFSGDDHDACRIEHNLASVATGQPRTLPEVSVKAFSMAMGIHRPGYSLLSLHNSGRSSFGKTAADRACELPDQLGIYLHVYTPLLAFTVLAVFLPRLHAVLARRRSSHARSNGVPLQNRSHTRVLSRSMFGNRVRPAEEDSDELSETDEVSFAYNGSSFTQSDYAYSPGEAEEGMSIASLQRAAASHADADRTKQATRLSRYNRRAYLWEDRDGNVLQRLVQLGILNRWAIRPISRALRYVYRRIWSPSLRALWVEVSNSTLLNGTLRDLSRVVWVGVSIFVGINAWSAL
ncbi:uncharacterized protein L969DRAFT_20735 [Mixia osmundae IAM 14324]|uniref:Calcineurin-like phosphoesterase domain-containing protein n=1 Tax=Mixia osmundae (strain CBS 9802 / IAM 14324 / JCM 22182 / KY 12970) TaxID=764103 RepID=G7DSQ2_MIXOS|nr:uncharacterized protein L969DRAFT_20735 [Mixia osmundae IAM 14324]KEI41793.1 hypothetical protein L969DRAFT_20735 [Mixia osmundae IAM 14324]GAA93610.1 hypothetical protein E5Q_00254 [Mixia osmundae IAM 14324]